MSKRLLSLIKPRQILNSKPSKTLFYETHIKKLADEACQLLNTHENWDQVLDTRLSEESVEPSEICHLVFDRIKDVSLGLKFYGWFSHRKYCSSLDRYAYSSLLKLLTSNRMFSEVENVLHCMKKEDVLPTIEAFDVLIRAYADSGLVEESRELYKFVNDEFDCMPNVFACNSLLNGLVKSGRFEIAQKVYDEMLERDDSGRCCLDNHTTSIMVKGLCERGKVEEGRKLIEDRWGKGCVPNVVLYNTLIDGYCKKGEIANANRVLEEMKFKGFIPSVETYGAIVNGHCREGNFEEIDKVLAEMKMRGLKVNVQIYNNIIDARYKHGCSVDPYDMIRRVKDGGCKPDIQTYNILISGLCNSGQIEEANAILELALKRGLAPDQYSYTPLIHFYCKQGDTDKASCLLIEMTRRGHKPDMVTYGALVHGLVVCGETNAAFNFRKKMIERGVMPDAAIYNVIMKGLFGKGCSLLLNSCLVRCLIMMYVLMLLFTLHWLMGLPEMVILMNQRGFLNLLLKMT